MEHLIPPQAQLNVENLVVALQLKQLPHRQFPLNSLKLRVEMLPEDNSL